MPVGGQNPALHIMIGTSVWRIFDRRDNASSSSERATAVFGPGTYVWDLEYVPSETSSGYIGCYLDGVLEYEFFGQTMPTGTICTGFGDEPIGAIFKCGCYASETGLPAGRPSARVVVTEATIETLAAVVSGDGSDWNTIQTAITAATAGDVIVIKDGDYLFGSANKLTVSKQLTLVSQSRLGVKLYRDVGNATVGTGMLIELTADGVILDDLRIWGPTSATDDPDAFKNPRDSATAKLPDTTELNWAGVAIKADNCVVKNCDIHNWYHTGLGYGVVVMDGSDSTMIMDTYFFGCRHAVATDGNVTGTVTNTTVQDCEHQNHEDSGFDCHSGAVSTSFVRCTARAGSLTQLGAQSFIIQGTKDFILTDCVADGSRLSSGSTFQGFFVQYVDSLAGEDRVTGTISGCTADKCQYGFLIQENGAAPTAGVNVVLSGSGNTVANEVSGKLLYDAFAGPSNDYADNVSPITAGTLTAPPTVFT